MKYDPDRHRRMSTRLKGYDYSQAGAYFVTILTKHRELFFENLEIKAIADEYWRTIPSHYTNVAVDEYVIMPNHIHGILVVRVQNFEPLHEPFQHRYQHTIPKSVGSIIRAYKAAVTIWCRNNSHEYFSWQRNYYEHVIRDEDDLNRIREYIQNNPLNWDQDENNPRITLEAMHENQVKVTR